MNIFHEIKSMISVRQVAESYGLKVNRNGMACCPFHNDKHPSMKIDSSHYYCFGCGTHGDAIGYVAEMFSLSQYDAAYKIIQDFKLPIETEHKISDDEKNSYRKLVEQKQYAETVKKRFERWADETIDQLKESKHLIEEAKDLIFTKEPGTAVISNGFAYMLHQQEKIEYWLDILCMGDEADKRQLFLMDGKEVKRIAANIKRAGDEILGRNRKRVG